MPKPSKQSIRPYYSDRIDEAHIKVWASEKRMSREDILRTLSNYGLGLHEVRLVYYRAVRGLTFKELVEKQGWVSYQSACYHYKEALRKLRVGGFKL